MTDKTISGYALKWDRPAIIGGLFEERFASTSLERSLRENPDVVALWAHDQSRPLGRVANGTLAVSVDATGLRYSLTPDTLSPLGQEALATVGRGTVDQVSVGFFSEEEQWDDSGDIPRRLITRATVYEISLVVWGAYGPDTSAHVRLKKPTSPSAKRAEAAMRARGILL